mgnify:CR=1 FL=1
MRNITLSEDDISSLDSYFEQIHLARPILHYEEAFKRAKHAAESWEYIWQYLIEHHNHTVPDHFSEHVLDIGFFFIYSQSISEHMLDLLMIDNFEIDSKYVYTNEEEVSLSSIKIDDKLSLLEICGIELPEEIEDRHLRNRFAHDAQISDYFLSSHDNLNLADTIDESYELVNRLCELVYGQEIENVAKTVHKVDEFHTVTSLEDAPAGSILLESIERPSGVQLDTDDLAGYTKEELYSELEDRGFSPDGFVPENKHVSPHIDSGKPVNEQGGVIIDLVTSSMGLSSNLTNKIEIELVCYNTDIGGERFIYDCKVAVDIENTKVITEEVDEFDDYSFRRRGEPTLDFELEKIPYQPWITVGITAVAESEDNYFVDYWEKKIPNLDWIRSQRKSAQSAITSTWLLIDNHSELDLDELGRETKLEQVLPDDDEFRRLLPGIEQLLNSARASLIRANDPVKLVDRDDLPPSVKIVPTEDGGRVEVLSGYIQWIESTNQSLKDELNSLLFEYDHAEDYYEDKNIEGI